MVPMPPLWQRQRGLRRRQLVAVKMEAAGAYFVLVKALFAEKPRLANGIAEWDVTGLRSKAASS